MKNLLKRYSLVEKVHELMVVPHSLAMAVVVIGMSVVTVVVVKVVASGSDDSEEKAHQSPSRYVWVWYCLK